MIHDRPQNSSPNIIAQETTQKRLSQRQNRQSLRERILSLSPEQRRLFRQQLEAKGIPWDQAIGAETGAGTDTEIGALKAKNVARRSRPDKLPLSASQQHLWILHQLYPDTCAYHIALSLRIHGDLSVAALRQSLQCIVNRHDSLRTVFVKADNQPWLKVLPQVELALPIVDLSTEENPYSVVEHWQQTLVQTPFNLEIGPLIRAQLLRLDTQAFELILVLHHLIADGWSRGILLRELAAYYRHMNASQVAMSQTELESVLPALSFQYADYLLQQQQWLASNASQQQLDYWKNQLADITPLALPHTGEAGTDFSSQICTRRFSIEQTQAIKALAKQAGTTVFTVLLAIFKLLLHRYSRQADIAVGVPVAGRSSVATEALIGFFVNTLVLRSQVDSDSTFTDWLKQVQATLADALQHQDVPFAKVVDAVGAQRIPGQNPLFRVMFQVQSGGYELQNAQQLDLDLPGLTLTQQWIAPSETKFDMSWHVIERDEALLVAVEYRASMFEGDRIKSMLSHFQTLVDAVVTSPNRVLSDFSLLSDSEKEQILTEWSQGKSVECSNDGFPARFEQQVEKTPQAIAVSDRANNLSLSYQQLNQRANKLAHWLRSQGIGPDRLVALCLPHGIDLMTALIATLKSGAAYIPIDPTLPPERVQYMLQDARPNVLIIHSDCLESSLANSLTQFLPNQATQQILYIDKDDYKLIAQPGHNPASATTPEHLAYVIYTSGSTGRPKGTLLTHGGLINYLDWCLTAYPVTQGSGAPVQSSIGFDATITSLFSPLLAGKQVAFNLADTEIESIQTALSEGFSFIKLTPAHLSALQPLLKTQMIERSQLPKAFIIGGEALKEHHISLWRERYPEIALFNEYGPTEAVVGCCVHQVTEKDSGNIPIGRPIHGVQLYVLDEHKQPVPAGIPGELYIGGRGVARGYLNRQELTKEKFICGDSSSVLYKTGDLASYRCDGTIEYLGRIDDQIKLRGFRIEPGEIEATLCEHSQIDQAVVTSVETEVATDLVGYVVSSVSANQTDALLGELHQMLNHRLPSYMVPSHIVILETLPLTTNGKVNKSALPKPTTTAATETVQPRNHKEEILRDIWQQILGKENLSIHDNFFDLGGDSISGMQIVSKANEKGLTLTPAQLFESQTIAQQAAVAKESVAGQILTAPEIGDIPLSPIQKDFFDQNRPEPYHYNQAVLLTVNENLNIETLKSALSTLIHHHDSLRLRFELTESGWRQSFKTPEETPLLFESVDLTQPESLSLEETVTGFQSSLNLQEGPLFRSVLLTVDSGKRLLLIAHHLLVDGVSWRILLADLVASYQQVIANEAVSLPARTTSFGTWTKHLRTQVENDGFQAEIEHWLETCRSTQTLPVDHSSGKNTVSETDEVFVELSPTQTAALKSTKVSVNVVLLTALVQTLKQWSQLSTVTVDIEGHGRRVWNEQLDLSRTTGWFTARYPVRFSLPSSSLEEQLSRVQQKLRQVPNQGVGYGALRAYSQGLDSQDSDSQDLEKELTSPAQVSFNYLGQLILEPNEIITGIAPEPVTATQSPAGDRTHLFEIIALIQNDQLIVRWRYSQQQYQRNTIEQLSQQFYSNLQSLIASQSHTSKNSSTANRFSAARVDAGQLNQLLGKLQAREGQS